MLISNERLSSFARNVNRHHCCAGTMPGALAGATKLAGIEEVEIDSTGRFKYILCKVYEQGGNPATGAVKHVVRGTSRAEFHCELIIGIGLFGTALGLFGSIWALQ